MARGNAYCHSFMRMQNVNTESPEKNDEIFQLIDNAL